MLSDALPTGFATGVGNARHLSVPMGVRGFAAGPAPDKVPARHGTGPAMHDHPTIALPPMPALFHGAHDRHVRAIARLPPDASASIP
jgi:hypothetical protein